MRSGRGWSFIAKQIQRFARAPSRSGCRATWQARRGGPAGCRPTGSRHRRPCGGSGCREQISQADAGPSRAADSAKLPGQALAGEGVKGAAIAGAFQNSGQGDRLECVLHLRECPFARRGHHAIDGQHPAIGRFDLASCTGTVPLLRTKSRWTGVIASCSRCGAASAFRQGSAMRRSRTCRQPQAIALRLHPSPHLLSHR